MRWRAPLLLLLTPFFLHAQAAKAPPYAITGAKVVVPGDKVLPKATVVVRDGVIVDVGPDAKVPADAVVIDGADFTIYPGLIDAGGLRGYDAAMRRSAGGPPSPDDLASDILAATKADNRRGLTPEFEVHTALKTDEDAHLPWRRLGFTMELAIPEGGILSGRSTLLSLNSQVPRTSVVKPVVALHASLRNIPGADYPRALMGVVAHARQTFMDAGWHQRRLQAFEAGGRVGARPPFDPCWESLVPALEGKLPVVFEADRADDIHRALDFAAEFKLKPIIFGGREAWKVKDRLKAAGVPVVLRLNFSEPGEKEGELPARVKADRERQRKEEAAGANVLHQAGVKIAFASAGIPGDQAAGKFRENLRKALKEGLPPAAALQALTQNAAELFGVSNQYGTIAPGKAANFVIADGDLFEPDTFVKYVFADGIKLDLETPARPKKDRPMGKKDGDKKDPPAKEPPPAKGPEPTPPKTPAPGPIVVGPSDGVTELDIDRVPKLHTKGSLLLKNTTILTASRPARLEKADLLVIDGKIKAFGPNDETRAFTGPTLDAEGMFVMPGIIDSHAHFAISGGVNEFSLSVVPEVRVRDVIESDDEEIYRAAAGGVTVARLLHGSANVIGGQDAVIKLKYGLPAKDLLLADVPRGVKFALGENVKRGDGRFPNSRPGVEAVLVRAFSEAQAYRKTWEEYANTKDKLERPEPRRDLRLEALVDVLKGDLKIHCHCYRSDEILMLLRVADRFGVKVKSLQHVLEGYKVAPEIAAHGASVSMFSDWWAYKIEAFDAIPFGPYLMHEAGASVCLKSDSNELVRHLYQEAAKLIKYGGLTEEEALKTITLNPAKQLGLDGRTGSIEVGKDADLAVFNGHPLNGFSRCEMTVIDGEVYFQRGEKFTPYKPAAEAPTPNNKEVLFPRFKTDAPILLRNVTIHNPGKAPIAADVRLFKGKIIDVGRDLEAKTDTVLNSRTLHVFPGMIDAGTVLGLTELGQSRETHDYADGGDFQPDLRAAVAVNPESELIPVTRANGVLTVVTRPSGPMIAGQAALINLSGWVPKDMVVVEQLALHIDFPVEVSFSSGDPTMPSIGRAVAKKQREEKIRKLKDLFAEAKRYEASRKENANLPVVPRLEALLPYVRGEKPVIVSAYRKGEILEAIKLADDLKFKMILSGAVEAWKVVDELKKRDIPVIVGPVMTMPQEGFDPYDAPYSCPAKLHAASVRFCIRSTGASNTRNLPYEAAMAVSYGLPADEALKAVTISPAQILGVADSLGSIDPGKRANLVITNGDLLQPSTQVLGLFIDGKPIEPTSKHTRLFEKYAERLKEFKEGKTGLGTK